MSAYIINNIAHGKLAMAPPLRTVIRYLTLKYFLVLLLTNIKLINPVFLSIQRVSVYTKAIIAGATNIYSDVGFIPIPTNQAMTNDVFPMYSESLINL